MAKKPNGTKAQRHEVAIEVGRARTYCLKETEDGDVWYWGFDEENGTIYAGGATNSGVIREVEIPYDFDNDIDGNMVELSDEVEDRIARRQ